MDLDGTVVDSANTIPPQTVDALHACHEAGIALTFLTGRRPATTAPHLERLGLPCRVATNSGCLRWEYPGWKLTGERRFDQELVAPVADMLAPYSANFYVNSHAEGFEYYLLDRQPTPELEEYLVRYGFRIRRINAAAQLNGAPITQIAMPGPDGVVMGLRDAIMARFPGRVLALAVRWPLLGIMALELFHPLANKGDALKQFAGELGIEQARTLAAGDDVNDLAMLKWAGHGVAMPGAGAEVVAAAGEQLEGNGAAALAPYLRGLLELPV
ncbi:MAG: HAD family phosphatase [Anaerolineae bacterium]|nr:HAD family phosphatase [Anaerolineae bacterium]